MDPRARPYRSVLYIPGSKPRALEKAKSLAVDAIIFDLEDAVAPSEKTAARETLAKALIEGGYAPRATLVRINGLDTEWWKDDLAAVAPTSPDAILLPKVDGPAHIAQLAAAMEGHAGLADTTIWAMIESPLGVLNALGIAQVPRMGGFVVGTNDLAKDLGVGETPDRMPLWTALQTCVLAARGGGIAVIDGVYNAFRDAEGLAREAAQGRAMGFDGKSLIHPAQVEVANQAFRPSPEALDLAARQIAAHEEAEAAGQGVAVLDGKIVEGLHVTAARQIIARADAIAALETPCPS